MTLDTSQMPSVIALRALPEEFLTARTQFRLLLNEDDAAALTHFYLANNDTLSKTMGVAKSREGIARQVEIAIDCNRSSRLVNSEYGILRYGVWHRRTNSFLGIGSLDPFGEDALEVAMAVSGDAAGAGFGSEIVGALTYLAAKEPGIYAITARVDSQNARSAKIFKSMQFRMVLDAAVAEESIFSDDAGIFPSGRAILYGIRSEDVIGEGRPVPERYRPITKGSERIAPAASL